MAQTNLKENFYQVLSPDWPDTGYCQEKNNNNKNSHSPPPYLSCWLFWFRLMIWPFLEPVPWSILASHSYPILFCWTYCCGLSCSKAGQVTYSQPEGSFPGSFNIFFFFFFAIKGKLLYYTHCLLSNLGCLVELWQPLCNHEVIRLRRESKAQGKQSTLDLVWVPWWHYCCTAVSNCSCPPPGSFHEIWRCI